MNAAERCERRRAVIKNLIRENHTTIREAADSLGWPHWKLRNRIDRGDPTQLPVMEFCTLSILAGVGMEKLLDELLKI